MNNQYDNTRNNANIITIILSPPFSKVQKTLITELSKLAKNNKIECTSRCQLTNMRQCCIACPSFNLLKLGCENNSILVSCDMRDVIAFITGRETTTDCALINYIKKKNIKNIIEMHKVLENTKINIFTIR